MLVRAFGPRAKILWNLQLKICSSNANFFYQLFGGNFLPFCVTRGNEPCTEMK
jgi:hypothetical protein